MNVYMYICIYVREAIILYMVIAIHIGVAYERYNKAVHDTVFATRNKLSYKIAIF